MYLRDTFLTPKIKNKNFFNIVLTSAVDYAIMPMYMKKFFLLILVFNRKIGIRIRRRGNEKDEMVGVVSECGVCIFVQCFCGMFVWRRREYGRIGR